MALQNPEDFFHFELSLLRSMEQQLVQALGTMSQEVQDQQLKQALQTHQQQTQQHVQRIEQCFQHLNQQPMQAQDQTVAGMLKQHENLKNYHQPSQQVLTMFDAASAEVAERYEIAKYEGFIDLCQHTNHEHIGQMLQQNLQEDQQAAQQVKQIVEQLSQQVGAAH